MTALQQRIPPQFLEGERAILGGLLIDNDAVPKVIAELDENDFYWERHREIFRAIKGLFERNQPADWLTVTNALKAEGTLETVGGPEELTNLADAVPSAANVMHYVTQVKGRSLLRQVITAAVEITQRAHQDHEDVDAFLDEAETIIFRVGESRIQTTIYSAGELMKSSLQTVERLYERRENITGVPSGFKDLDHYTAGFQPTDLIIIAGRPSMGKTALALNVALHAAIEDKTPVLVFSLEMGKDQIALRMLCARASVNLRNLRTGYLTDSDWSRLVTAAGPISSAPVFVDDAPALTSLEIRAKARRLKKEKGIGLIIVDYLQLMRGHTRAGEWSREREISEISRSLKALAKELNVPVIALSQLNRKVEERPNKRPQLADLRESGAIEQDADVILFLYRDELYNKADDNPKKGQAEIIIGKQRNGPIGTVTAYFDATFSSFRPFTRRDDDPQRRTDTM